MIGLSHVMFFIVVITTGRCHSAVSLGHLIHVCKTSAQDHFDSEIITLALMAEIRFMKGCQPKAVNRVTKCYKKQGKGTFRPGRLLSDYPCYSPPLSHAGDEQPASRLELKMPYPQWRHRPNRCHFENHSH